MITSENGYQLIRDNEGFSAHVYADAGHQAIGYGHDLLPGESYPNGIDEAHAEFLLSADVAKAENALNPLIPEDCTQNQFDALVDFTYNLGAGAVKEMLAHGWSAVPTQIVRWDHAGGQVLPGLLERRQKELALFQTP